MREFVKEHPEHVAKDNSLNFIVDDVAQGLDARYNLCVQAPMTETPPR